MEVNTSQTVMSLIIAPVFQRGLDLHGVGGEFISLYCNLPQEGVCQF